MHLMLLVIVAAVFTSCSNDEYLNVIPENASVVVSVNTKGLYKKIFEENKTLLDKMNEGVDALGDEAKDAKEMIKNPENMGIDFRVPVYAFVTPAKAFGMTMKVADEDKLENFIELLKKEGVCSEAKEREGVKMGTISDFVFAYNSKTLLIYGNTNAGLAVNQKAAAELLGQDAEKSFTATEAFDKLKGIDERDITAFCNLDVLPADVASKMTAMNQGYDLKDFSFLSSLNIEKGRLVFAYEMLPTTDKGKETMKEWSKHYRKIEGRYIDSPCKDFFIWGCFGVDGEWTMENIKKNSDAKQVLYALERAVDVEKIIRAIDGDVAFQVSLPQAGLGALMNGNSLDNYIVTANVKNTDFLKDIDYWKRSMRDYGMTMKDVGKNEYLLSAGELSFNLGVDDDNFYIASTEAYKKNAFSERSAILKDVSGDIKSSLCYVYANLKVLHLENFNMFVKSYGITLDHFKALILKANEDSKCELILEMDDPDENLIKQLLN